METRLGPLRLANPTIGAAGAFGFLPPTTALATEKHLCAEASVGAVVTATVAHQSRRGSTPRIVEVPAGALLVPGAARLSVRYTLRRYGRSWAASAVAVVVSLDGDSPAELAAGAGELEGVPGIAAIELPLSNLELVADSVRAVRRACALPVWVKSAPDAPDLLDTVAEAAAAGAVAATIGGGLQAAAADGTSGYLIGPASFTIVLAIVRRVAPRASLPVIANGGVATAEHARAYLRAGAAAVQVGSAQCADPRAALTVAAACRPDGA